MVRDCGHETRDGQTAGMMQVMVRDCGHAIGSVEDQGHASGDCQTGDILHKPAITGQLGKQIGICRGCTKCAKGPYVDSEPQVGHQGLRVNFSDSQFYIFAFP